MSVLNNFVRRPMYWKNLSEFCEGAEFLAVRRHKNAERWLVGHCTYVVHTSGGRHLVATYLRAAFLSKQLTHVG